MKLKLVLGLMCVLNVGCANFVLDGEEQEATAEKSAAEKVVAPAEDMIVAKSDTAPSVVDAPSVAATPSVDEVETSFPPQQPKALSTEPVHPYKRDDGEVGSVVLMSKKDAAATASVDFASAKIPSGVPAEKALGWLKNGNLRFVKGTVRRDGQSAKDRKRVAAKQTPHAAVLSCSDSVAPPEIIFDQKLGEIGVVRTSDGSINDVATQSIEGVVKQGAHLIVVLSYTGCGSKLEQSDAAQSLGAKSTLLDALIKSGQVTIKTAIYDQDNGRVTF